MPKISVIVAIYKVEKYLEECIDSIINQTYRDLEVILVDDGSTDSCPSICDRYSKLDNRVSVIHQNNQGLVMARKNGLTHACGEYVSFIDGDDWLDENMYELMIECTHNNDVDIVITGYVKDGSSKNVVANKIDTGIYKGQDLCKVQQHALLYNSYYNPGINASVWNKLFKRKLLTEIEDINPIIRMGEDAAITYPAINKARCVVVDNSIQAYHYRYVDGSMSREFDNDYFKRISALVLGMKKELSNNENMYSQLVYYYLYLIQLGVESLFSRNCHMHLYKKLYLLRENRKMLREVESVQLSQLIDWSIFDWYTREYVKAYMYGSPYKLIFLVIFKPVIIRVSNLKNKNKE